MSKKETCKNCQSCRASYKGGLCMLTKKRVKYTDTCDSHKEK